MTAILDDRLRGRLLRLGVLAGAIVWPLWWVLGGAGPSMMDDVRLAVAGGITTIAPLALLLSASVDRRGGHLAAWTAALALWPIAAPLALFALTLEPGPEAGAMTAPWLLFTGLLALVGVQRFGRRSFSPLADVAIDAGLVYGLVGGIWLLAAALGRPLLGFTEPWVSLTAAHFHTAGLGLPILAGIAARAARVHGLVTAPVLLSAIAGPILTALGIAGWPALELAGGLVMCVASFGTGGLLVLLAWRGAVPVLGRAPLLVAGLVPVATMALALVYALAAWADPTATPSLDSMVRWHGLPNAILFVAAGLGALALSPPPSMVPPPGAPFSTLRGGARIGRWFFAEIDAVVPGPDPEGTVDDMGAFARSGVDGLEDFDPASLHPAVVRSYEHTADYVLRLRAEWRFGFRTAAKLYRALVARPVGQLDLPQAGEGGMDTQLLRLRDDLDGRGPVIGWVRCHPGTDHPVYVAAYATHRDRGVPFMNIAFPLPGLCFHSILRMDPVDGGGLRLTTRRPASGRVDDAGLWLATPIGSFRLPMHEELTVQAVERGDDAAPISVRQHVWLLGIRFVTLEFRLTPRAPR